MRAPSWTASLLACVALLGALSQLSSPAPGMGAALPCVNAQLIEGQLRCDHELLDDRRARCADAPSRALGPGDALEPAACVCAAYPALRQIGLGCAASPADRMPPGQLAALEQAVDLNTASVDELASLAGIGPKLAQGIVEGRPYTDVSELLEVRGIGAKRLAAICGRVRPRCR